MQSSKSFLRLCPIPTPITFPTWVFDGKADQSALAAFIQKRFAANRETLTRVQMQEIVMLSNWVTRGKDHSASNVEPYFNHKQG